MPIQPTQPASFGPRPASSGARTSQRAAAFQQALAAASPRQAPVRQAPASAAQPTPAIPQSLINLPGGIGTMVAEAARRYGVDPALIAGVIEAESGFNPHAVSGAGAKGLMQLMDGTARGLGVTDSFDRFQNILGGAKHLGNLLARYGGDARLALAAYNAGAGAVDRYGGIPPYGETQRYVPRVLAAMEKYAK